MREKEVRVQVSGARSAQKRARLDVERCQAHAAHGDAVRRFSVPWRQYRAAMVIRRFSPRLHDAGYLSDFFDDSSKHCCSSLPRPVRIRQVSLNREIFSKPMQLEIDFTYAASLMRRYPGPAAKGIGARSRQNLRSVVEENLVHDAGGKRRPVHHGAAFDHQAGDLQLTESGEASTRQVGPPVGVAGGHLLDPDAPFSSSVLLSCSPAKEQNTSTSFVAGLHHSRIERQAQAANRGSRATAAAGAGSPLRSVSSGSSAMIVPTPTRIASF